MWRVLLFLGGICFFVSQCNAQSTKWDSLKVKWGPSPKAPGAFEQLPATEKEALASGWVKINECAGHYPWKGKGYLKNSDGALLLLYDVNGYIAGVQEQVPKNQPNGFPSAFQKPPFVNDGGNWTITVYFTDPSKICTKGRTAKQFKKEGIGSQLYIQNSTQAEDSIIIPRSEAGIVNSLWTQGLCFPMMGMHYWYNLREDMNCDKSFPIFLLYTGGQLVGFGWIFLTDLSSPNYEHPPPGSYKMFAKSVPQCMLTAGVTSTMHFYFTSQPGDIAC